MKISIALTLAVFLCLAPVASAITLDDTTTIQNSTQFFVDGVQIKKINVSVLPTDGVVYNITASSSKSILTARLIGVIAFSNLTYYHPEVTYGWIGIFLDNTSKPVFFDIYPSDLLQIVDRKHTSQSEALKVANNIKNQRGTKDSISEHPTVSTYSNIQSYPKSSTTSKKSITSDYSSHSSDCEPVYVKGHYRSGKWVNAYYRSKPGC